MNKLVIFKKQKGEKVNAYSLVNDEILKNIPQDIILKIVDVEEKSYSKEELETLRKEALS